MRYPSLGYATRSVGTHPDIAVVSIEKLALNDQV